MTRDNDILRATMAAEGGGPALPTRRRILAGGMAALALAAPAGRRAMAAAPETRLRGVVELFTSQGCSSCPPADRILSGLAARDDLLALSWHVDYWNYLGWRDTFSDARFSERQRGYAAAFGRRSVYTPMAVINGRAHVVGSRAGHIDKALARDAEGGQAPDLPIRLGWQDGTLFAHCEAKGDATLWLVSYDAARTAKIERGENAGRTIEYHNVVRAFTPVGMMKSGALDATVAPAALRGPGEKRALLMQRVVGDGAPGAILGAVVLDAKA